MTDRLDAIEQALAPCPFCGGEAADATVLYSPETQAINEWDHNLFFYVSCVWCGSCNRGLVGHHSREAAREHWNTRHAESDLTALRESHAAAVSHGRSEMSDDLLDTVSKALALDTGCLCGLPQCAECRAWSPLVENRNILRALLARCEAAEHALAAERIENAHLRAAFVTMERAANQHEAEAARLRDLLLDGLSHGIDDYWITTAEGVEWRERVKAALDTPAREGGDADS